MAKVCLVMYELALLENLGNLATLPVGPASLAPHSTPLWPLNAGHRPRLHPLPRQRPLYRTSNPGLLPPSTTVSPLANYLNPNVCRPPLLRPPSPPPQQYTVLSTVAEDDIGTNVMLPAARRRNKRGRQMEQHAPVPLARQETTGAPAPTVQPAAQRDEASPLPPLPRDGNPGPEPTSSTSVTSSVS